MNSMTVISEITTLEANHWALPDIAEKINAATRPAESHARSAVQSALTAGSWLMQAKNCVPHGEWHEWLAANCAVAPRTAQAYMRLFNTLPRLEVSDAQRVADLPLREAMRAIATAPEYPAAAVAVGRRARPWTETDKAAEVFNRSSVVLKKSAKVFSLIRQLNGKQVGILRSSLLGALEALDALQNAEILTEAQVVS